MGSEGVAEGVRVHVGGEAALDGDSLDDAAYAAGREASLAGGLGGLADWFLRGRLPGLGGETAGTQFPFPIGTRRSR